ncbi:MAG: hypothetical protein HY814_07505, partial [Candidatus Riflebacteria bacterium]|nr:hypothetical protein [Candidatus Riflebacteria bacterium]
MSRRIVRLALATALTVGRVGAAELVETVERTLSVGEAPRISITHVSGIVRLGSHGAPQMIVKAVTRAREGDSHAAQAALRQTTVAIEGAVGQATMRFCFAGQ